MGVDKTWTPPFWTSFWTPQFFQWKKKYYTDNTCVTYHPFFCSLVSFDSAFSSKEVVPHQDGGKQNGWSQKKKKMTSFSETVWVDDR